VIDIKDEILNLATVMEDILSDVERKLRYQEYDAELAKLLNSLIDGVVYLNNEVKPKDLILENAFANFADVLVLMVNSFENNPKDLKRLYIKLFEKFNIWQSALYGVCNFQVVLFGFSNITAYVLQALNDKNLRIRLVSEFEQNCRGRFQYEGVVVQPIEKVISSEYDYFIICTDNPDVEVALMALGICKDKIINLFKLMMNYIDIYTKVRNESYEYNYLLSRIRKAKSNDDYELFITGLSYALKGLDEALLVKKSVKLACNWQDLYYDFLIAQDILSVSNKFKYCIIGLSCYSFNFDLSYSSGAYRISEIYYPMFRKLHHGELPADYKRPVDLEKLDDIIQLNDPIFGKKFLVKCIEEIFKIDFSIKYDEVLWDRPCETNITKEALARKRALHQSGKIFEQTRLENIKIFKEYLDLLKKNKIIPIVIVFPTDVAYYANFNESMRVDFYSIINEFIVNYDIQFYDYFNSSLFNENDFADGDHLNRQGALKMTGIVNKILEVW
jgi:hypothetical protein